jgi:WD40 repeat protein
VLATIAGTIAGSLAFDPFNGSLIAAFTDGTVATFDPRTGDRRSQVATGESFGYVAVGARSDGSLIMVSRSNIELVDPSTGVIGSPYPIQDVRQAFVRPDGLVVTIKNDAQADVYDLDANAIVDRSYEVLPRGWVAVVDGTAAVLQEREDGAAVELIDLSTGERTIPELAMPDGTTFAAVAAYPTTDGVMAVSRDHSLARWRGDTLVDELFMGPAPGTQNDDWYPGGRLFGDHFAVLGRRADNSIEASLIRVDGASGAEIVFTVETDLDLDDENNRAGMAHPSASGGLFVIEQTGRLTEYGPTGEVLGQVETGVRAPVAITVDPTGSKLAVSSLDGGVALVDIATGQVEQVPGDYIASSLGFDGDGTVLGISVWGGEVRLHDVGSGAVPTLVWDGTGTFGAEPGWYDPGTDSLWLPASGQVLEIPLDPARWVAKACEIVGRGLTEQEWERYVPGDEPLRSIC